MRVVLFVRLRDGLTLDEALRGAHQAASPQRRHAAPRAREDRAGRRHPAHKSGKIVELAVRNVVHGRPVKNIEALANPEALDRSATRRAARLSARQILYDTTLRSGVTLS